MQIMGKFIIASLSVAKYIMMIMKPYFFDLTLAHIKINMDSFKIVYFFSSIIADLMEFDLEGFGAVLILSFIFIQSALNIFYMLY